MNICKNFVIRVYGIIRNDKNEILVSDEFQLDTKMTKFPGGGLEFGEGTVDGIRREIREECNGQEIMDILHFYTTDFYQKALFYEDAQLISIYYTAKLKPPIKFRISTKTFDFGTMENGKQSFRWVEIKQLRPEDFTFPIDKFVVQKLRETYLK